MPCIAPLLVEHHLPAPLAAAADYLIIHRESGCDPKAYSPTQCNGPCRGLVQWDAQRWRTHLARCRRTGLDPYSLTAQADFLAYEWLRYWPRAAARAQRLRYREALALFDRHFMRGYPDE